MGKEDWRSTARGTIIGAGAIPKDHVTNTNFQALVEDFEDPLHHDIARGMESLHKLN